MVDYDITESIPVPLSNPSGPSTYTSSGEAYDIAISGQPFFIQAADDTPYRRVTAQYRKQQYDQTREAGEQSLTGWWFRSQSSFHLGAGAKFFEPAQDEGLRFQYWESKGCDVWTRGQVSLILDVDATHHTTGTINANLRPQQFLRSIQWTQNSNTYLGCLMLDGYDLDKIYPTITATVTNKALTSNVATLTTSPAHGFAVGMEITVSGVDSTFNGTYTIASVPTTTTFTYAKTASNVTSQAATGSVYSYVQHFVDYNAGTDDKVYAVCDDGIYAYWITNVTSGGSTKLTMYKKLLTDYSSIAATKMFDVTGTTVTNAVMEFTKERIVACINNKVYEIPPNATALTGAGGGTLVYTHPVDDFVYTSITSSGAAIYCSGFSGTQSNIQKFTLSSSGSMPTLTSAITAAEMPSGELIYKIAYYLGYMMIGTTKGIRVAAVADDGSLAYGPLIWENSQPVYDFCFRDNFAWAATSVDDEPGTIRIDLGTPISPLVFPYANDSYKATGDTTRKTTACAFIDGTDRICFTTNATGAGDGSVYIESADRYVSSGYIQTGFIRFNTLELKRFKFVLPQFDTTNGSLEVRSVDYDYNEFGLGLFGQGDAITEITSAYPASPQQYLGYKFIFSLGDDDTISPVFTGYQVKALPAVPRQRLIQYPVLCYDHEMDKFGVSVGYEGSAWQRMQQLETIENAGDTIRVEDFRTGESYVGLIEEIDFINKTPTDKRFSGFGGVLMVTIRSV